MEAGAAFLLLVIVIVVAVIGFGVWLMASSLRRRKLSSSEDKVDRHMEGARGPIERRRERPEHKRVSNEQGSRSVPHG